MQEFHRGLGFGLPDVGDLGELCVGFKTKAWGFGVLGLWGFGVFGFRVQGLGVEGMMLCISVPLSVCVCVCVCACACMCICARARARARVCVCFFLVSPGCCSVFGGCVRLPYMCLCLRARALLSRWEFVG